MMLTHLYKQALNVYNSMCSMYKEIVNHCFVISYLNKLKSVMKHSKYSIPKVVCDAHVPFSLSL